MIVRTQDFAEETQEFQTGVDDNRFRRRLRTTSTAPVRAGTQSSDFPASAVVETYLSCLQAGLQARTRHFKIGSGYCHD